MFYCFTFFAFPQGLIGIPYITSKRWPQSAVQFGALWNYYSWYLGLCNATLDGSCSEWCPRERTAWIEKFAQVWRHLPFQFVHYCLHPHFAACVSGSCHTLVVYRKDSHKAQVVITVHFTVFEWNVIAVACNLTRFSEYRTVLGIRFPTPFTVSLVKIVPIFNFMD